MKRHWLKAMLVSLFCFVGIVRGETTKEIFVQRAIKEAVKVHREYPNVPVSAIVAQAIYESNYGSSPLAVKYNNFHGLKAYHWKGDKAKVKVKEEGRYVYASFRVFPDMRAGFANYCEFLQAKRYKSASKYKDNGVLFVRTILKAGYCPSDEYLTDIKRIMKRHNLNKFDSI